MGAVTDRSGRSSPSDRPDPDSAPASFRHLTGWRAAASAFAGVGLGVGGLTLLAAAARGEPGWVFLALAGAAGAGVGALVATLPLRLTTVLSADGLTLGWLFGRSRVSWQTVRRAVVGPMGSGGERDPTTLSLLLEDRSEVLVAVLGRRAPGDDPAARAVLEACRARGIPVDEVLAPVAERVERERKWRAARLRGWR